ncbi:thermonuclease family protein [Methylobacterium sp. NFXW15]|uniref:thermonuclease family protein n=1 Tax=Methylobacterium sp. NFXW15 TaxID=2819512 RepID=UPI003CF6851E
MGLRRRFAPVALVVLAVPAGAEPAPHPDCALAPARIETLEGIGPRGELRFASGGRAVLDSLHWPEDETAARERIGARAGQRLAISPRGGPDRWGRERVGAESLTDGADLAGDLVAAGLVPVDPGEADELCRPALRLLEQAARRQRLGLWWEDPIDAQDGPALRRLAGHYAVVEGRVRHVGERSTRTYLDFVPRGGDGLTVTVTKRTWRRMAAHGLTADSLHDTRVRVRGVIDVRRGPILVAATPDAIEMLDGQDDSGVRR